MGQINTAYQGYNQHDASEFLSYLMDVIHEDLNRVINKPYTDSIDSNDRPDREVSQEFWIKHIKRNQSMIVDYFTGQF